MPIVQQGNGASKSNDATADNDDAAHPEAEMINARILAWTGPSPKHFSSAAVASATTRSLSPGTSISISERSGGTEAKANGDFSRGCCNAG